MNKIDLKRPTPIEADFALWAKEQAALIRAGQLSRVDLENVAEEIGSLGNAERYEIEHRLEVLLLHLLKWQFQPTKRKRGWKASIAEQRLRIARRIELSPSLKAYPAKTLAGDYILGRSRAIDETGLPEDTFPERCPYSVQQVLDSDFWPGGSDLPVQRKRRRRP
jgi:hypothetical protein